MSDTYSECFSSFVLSDSAYLSVGATSGTQICKQKKYYSLGMVLLPSCNCKKRSMLYDNLHFFSLLLWTEWCRFHRRSFFPFGFPQFSVLIYLNIIERKTLLFASTENFKSLLFPTNKYKVHHRYLCTQNFFNCQKCVC